MIKTLLTVVLASLCLFFSAAAQPISPLKIGDKIPDKLWNMSLQVANHPEGKKTITLRDYRGKLIILDFWATWCTACIAAMDVTHLLDKQFDYKLLTLPISHEPRKKVQDFIINNKVLKTINPFSIVEDKLLRKYFPNRSLPHYVWISPDGLYKGSTTSDEVHELNVQKILTSDTATLKQKIDLKIEPLLFLNAELLKYSKVHYYNLFFQEKFEGLSTAHRETKDANGNITGLMSTNVALYELYQLAARSIFRDSAEIYNAKRRIVESDYSDRILLDYSQPDRKKVKQNLYTYIANIPSAQKNQAYYQLLEDLNRYTDFIGSIEKRKVQCLVLKRTNKEDKIKTKGGKRQNTLFRKEGSIIRNHPLSALISHINLLNISEFPGRDETGYQHNVDLDFPTQPKNLEELNGYLKAYGFFLSVEERNIHMLVLRDKNRLMNTN